MTNAVRLTTLAIALAALCAPAVAQPAAQGPQAVVGYADLNLAAASGRAEFEHRIAAAAAALCGPAPHVRDLGAAQAYRACLRATVASVAPSIDQAVALQVRSEQHLATSAQR